MAGHGGPDIITDGLVLCLDAADETSYPGEPTTNMLNDPHGLDTTFSNQSWSGWAWDNKTNAVRSFYTEDSVVGGVSVKLTNSTVSSYAFWHSNIPVTDGLKYAVSVWAKNIDCPTIPYFSSAGSVSGGASFTGISTSTWTRFTAIFTATSTGNAQFYIRTNSNAVQGSVLIDGFQIEQKSHVTPFVNGTRSATDGWKDLTANGNHGDLTNMTFDSDAQMDFDGSSGYITTGYNLGSSVTQLTLGAWIKVDTYTNDGDCIALGDSSDGTGQCYLGVGTSGGNTMDWRFYTGDYLDETQYYTSSTDWIYYVGTYEQDSGQGRQKLYANGILKDTALSNNTSGIDFSGGKNVRIGTSTGDDDFFDGKINVVQIYNRSLSAKEVSQNFNAQRSRFGV